MKCCSIENGGSRVRGEVATGGRGPARRGLTEGVGLTMPHHRSMASFLGVAGGIKKRASKKSEPFGKNGRTGGSTEEEYEHVLPISLAQRPCSLPPLVPYFG